MRLLKNVCAHLSLEIKLEVLRRIDKSEHVVNIQRLMGLPEQRLQKLQIKPLMIYHSENPQALKGCDKNKLPVVWKSSKKDWKPERIFQN